MEARFDPTPLPTPRPPTVDVRVRKGGGRAPRARGFVRLLGLLTFVIAGTTVLVLVDAQRDLAAALAEARDEAAVLRRTLFRTEDELRRLKEAQRRAIELDLKRAQPPAAPVE